MTTSVTLLTKIHDSRQMRQFDFALKSGLEGLEDLEVKILGTNSGKWVQVELSGEDENIAVNYLIKNMGVCPIDFGSIGRFSNLKGYIKNLYENEENLTVDIGVFKPTTVYPSIPLEKLQAQLTDGRKIPLKKIAELFGFCENLPVNVKILEVDEKENRIRAELSTLQIEKYKNWQSSLLDRLIIIGSSFHDIKTVLENAMLERDVINIETLGMFEHCLTCKLGTDATGLISKLGRTLRNAKFTVFNPKKTNKFLE
jgi:hypothetical protein